MPLSIPHPVDEDRRFDLPNAFPNENDPELLVSNFLRLHETRTTDVFRGQLEEPCHGSTDIVCKLAYGLNNVKKLEREARLYEGKLKALQKTVVPTCHGYFVGHTEEGIIGCLVLDYCGEPVDLVFSALPRNFRCVSILEAMSDSQCVYRLDLVDAICHIHEAGIVHNDFAERNVLDHNGVPIIIDFEDAIEEVCSCKMEIIENALSPHPADFDCKELFDVCQDLGVWKPCASLHLYPVPRSPAHTYPALVFYGRQYVDVHLLEDVHELVRVAPRHWSRQRAYSTAFRTIENHTKKYYPEQYEAIMAKRSRC